MPAEIKQANQKLLLWIKQPDVEAKEKLASNPDRQAPSEEPAHPEKAADLNTGKRLYAVGDFSRKLDGTKAIADVMRVLLKIWAEVGMKFLEVWKARAARAFFSRTLTNS